MLELAVPWGMSYMIPQNGYHPLYGYLFRNRHPDIKLNCLDDVRTRQNLKRQPAEIDRLKRKGKHCLGDLPAFFSEYFNSDTLYLELGLAAEIPGDIEFAHTSPVVTGTRPFILHLESFFSLFLPFEGDPQKIIADGFEMKEPMCGLLASDNCVGIYSHLKQTIREIEVYFNCPNISNKLKYVPMGFDDGFQHPIRIPQHKDSPRFLVICSAHQNPNNFIDRGGVVVLKAWQKLKKIYPESQLIWRSQRPASNLMRAIKGSNIPEPESLLDSITWVERRLGDEELEHLFRQTDFVLLPSLWLHSTTILRALANGCIPIVSDIPHLDEYRSNGGTHAIEGISALNWKESKGIKVPNGALIDSPTVIDNLINKVKSLWKDRGLLAKQNSATAFETSYNGAERAKEFFSHVLDAAKKRPPDHHHQDDAVQHLNNLCGLAQNNDDITATCPTPVLLHVTDPVLYLDLPPEISTAFYGKYSTNTTVPKLVFQVADRVHEVSCLSWPAINKRLDGVSAYASILSDTYQVHPSASVAPVIERSSMNFSGEQVVRKYRQFLTARRTINSESDYNLGLLDVELVKDCGEFNLLRVYHLYVCYEKYRGPFPIVEFINDPTAYSPLLCVRKDLARVCYERGGR